MESNIFTLVEAANYLKMTVRTLRTLIKKGELKATKLGKAYRIRKIDVDKLFEDRKKL